MKKNQYKLAYTHFWVILIYNVRDIVRKLIYLQCTVFLLSADISASCKHDKRTITYP